MTEVIPYINEIKELDEEIRRMQTLLKNLRTKRSNVEKQIITYLSRTDQTAVKYKEIAIIAEDRDLHIRRRKTDKINTGAAILDKYGVSNAKDAVKEIIDAMRGSPVKATKLKVIPVNKIKQ